MCFELSEVRTSFSLCDAVVRFVASVFSSQFCAVVPDFPCTLSLPFLFQRPFRAETNLKTREVAGLRLPLTICPLLCSRICCPRKRSQVFEVFFLFFRKFPEISTGNFQKPKNWKFPNTRTSHSRNSYFMFFVGVVCREGAGRFY